MKITTDKATNKYYSELTTGAVFKLGNSFYIKTDIPVGDEDSNAYYAVNLATGKKLWDEWIVEVVPVVAELRITM